METITIQSKKEMLELVRTLYPNSNKKISKIEGTPCRSFEYSNKTVTVYTGDWEYIQYDLRRPVTYFMTYPVTITITHA